MFLNNLSSSLDMTSYLVFFGVLGTDQASKWMVSVFLRSGQKISLISSYFEICRVQNSGLIFGICSTWGYKHQYITAAVLLVAAVFPLVLMWTFRDKINNQLLLTRYILPLFAGGSLGNLIDRVFKGSVVDWMNSRLFTGPINIADIAVFSALAFFAGASLKRGAQRCL